MPNTATEEPGVTLARSNAEPNPVATPQPMEQACSGLAAGLIFTRLSAASEDEAVAIANDTVYGLNNSVFTNDLERAYAVGRRLRSGTVGHNGFKTDFKLGFGGFKQSGIGREGNIEGLEAYLENKTMIFDAAPQALGG